MATAAASTPKRPATPHSRFTLPGEARYVITAGLLMIALYAAYYYPYEPDQLIARLIEGYARLLASAAGALIATFDGNVRVEGTLIAGQFPLLIVKSCSALDAQALYVGALVAFPAPIRAKAIGLVLGIITLTSTNILRLSMLYFAGAHAPRAFDTLHEEVWPLVLVAIACVCFVVWMRWARRERAKAG